MKIGDKVRVKDYTFISEEMSKYNGKELEIVERDGLRGFVLKLDDNNFIKLNEEAIEKICEYQPKHAKEENVVASLFYAQHNMGKDGVQHPSHYNNEGGMECWDEMELIFGTEATMWFCLLSAWKYRYRMNDKDTPEKNMRKSNECIKKYKELKEKLEND